MRAIIPLVRSRENDVRVEEDFHALVRLIALGRLTAAAMRADSAAVSRLACSNSFTLGGIRFFGLRPQPALERSEGARRQLS